MKANLQIVKEINAMFPASRNDHPVCFVREGEDLVIVSGECEYKETFLQDGKEVTVDVLAVDYYGEFRGGGPWIDPKLVEYAEKLDCYWEWENPACICLAR